jgi:hypothetical protein
MGEKGDRRLGRIKLTYHRSATENPFTKSDLKHSSIGYESCDVPITRICNCYSLFSISLLLPCEKLIYGVQRKRLA